MSLLFKLSQAVRMYRRQPLIRTLLKKRLSNDWTGNGPDSSGADKLGFLTLLGTPEATIVVLADTYILTRRNDPALPDEIIAALMYQQRIGQPILAFPRQESPVLYAVREILRMEVRPPVLRPEDDDIDRAFEHSLQALEGPALRD